MAFTAKDVMMLRELTQAGMMDCKKALTACDGDMEKAKDFLREKGLAAAAKKASRIAAEGVVGSFRNEQVGVVVEVNCETDFVAKTDNFNDFVKVVAQQVAEKNPASVEELLEQDSVSTPGTTINGLLNESVLKIGEKLSIRRFARMEGIVDTYIHLGGKIGVLVGFDAPAELADNAEFKTVAHDIAMQIAAAKPLYLCREQVPAEEVEHEREIARAQALNEGKPAAIVEKMLTGRIEKYYKDICLVEQVFVKDSALTIKKLVEETGKKLGASIAIREFVRFEMGEGLQKREDNFAEEVMSQVNK